MIHFYKPTAKVTGTACSFYLNKKDNSFFSTLIKQDSWDADRRIGSFKQNKDNPNKRVNIKFSLLEVASIVDSIKRNKELSGYHGSNQIVRFKFAPYTKDGEQKGFSFNVTKESKEDSTLKSTYLIGFNFGEAELLQQHLSYLLEESFRLTDKIIEKSFNAKALEQITSKKEDASSELSDEEDDLW